MGILKEWQANRRLRKLDKKGKVDRVGDKKSGTVTSKSYTQKARKVKNKSMPGLGKTGTVSRGAKSAVHTKGGTYVKYKKDSKAAGSFRKAYAAACSGGKGGSFTWQGRSYACSAKKK